jgi:hydrogenase maturation protein HypF
VAAIFALTFCFSGGSLKRNAMIMRTQILVRGIVQGVGFRPYIFLLARRRALKGQVSNNAYGVFIELEGEAKAIEQFVGEIELYPPPLSIIESVERQDNLTPVHYEDFRIVESDAKGEKFTPISADIAVCKDCLKEMFDPQNRRYRYPFINCTNCGPRFTIIEDVPYDRAQTTMREFPMCRICRSEYENPADRRFHAEPIACSHCGPRLSLADAQGQLLSLDIIDGEDEIHRARELLLNGNILAIKGIGGFHLACDALNSEAVENLRHRKYREDKPFAMMASSVDVIRQYCIVSQAEEELLRSLRRPIVLLHRRTDAEIPHQIAPNVRRLGFMLPYAPLHYLLFEDLDRPLVMTSANLSDEPICYEDSEAFTRLPAVADYFLFHNRRIHIRTDDSVTRVVGGREMIVRRSRGYAPAPIKTAFQFTREILACGAELKNTFCLARDSYAFVSHHIGDLENLETLRSFTEGIEHYQRLFNLHPEVVAYDYHPEYLSTKYALALEDIETKIAVQHHHAHIASCMADNRIEGEVIGIAMDGLGFGTDNKFWGGEFFVAGFMQAERIAHLDYIPMPGGAKAIREPWRMAAAFLHRTMGDDFLKLDVDFVHNMNYQSWTALRGMMAKGTNSPETSSMGRLFDALASLLGLRNVANYEGQAAIELEAIAGKNISTAYEFGLDEKGSIIKAETVIKQVVEDLLVGVSAREVSAKFHNGVAELIVQVARNVREQRHLNRVVLSGGVFQNIFLLERVCRRLQCEAFEVFTHNRVPTNDGGISLGQAVIANARLASKGV